ncbi:hypothetical protein [Allocoleopsis sp.]
MLSQQLPKDTEGCDRANKNFVDAVSSPGVQLAFPIFTQKTCFLV